MLQFMSIGNTAQLPLLMDSTDMDVTFSDTHCPSTRQAARFVDSLKNYHAGRLLTGLFLLQLAGTSYAQILLGVEDAYGIPFELTLQVEPLGVLENDTLDGENAGENGATAMLVSEVSAGTLTCPGNASLSLCPDGSFNYSPGSGFTGTDSFVYQAAFEADVSTPVTVTLSACKSNLTVFSCWHEQAYLDKLTELGYSHFQESFEGAPWDSARSPDTASSITSKGVSWTSNHRDATPPHALTTGSGPARTGSWGIYDPQHGAATGTPTVCDVDNPPAPCLYHDGFSGTTAPVGSVLHAVGGYITGIHGANPAIILDNTRQITFGPITPGYQFIGVIDTNPAGFTRFEVRELDGKIGQALYIWADDFTLAPVIADGDLAPRGSPDGLINAADYLIAQRIALGLLIATPQEILHADFTPIGAPDGIIDMSDLILLLRLVLATP